MMDTPTICLAVLGESRHLAPRDGQGALANRPIIRMAETLRYGVSTRLVSTERDGYFALLKRPEEVATKERLVERC